MRRTFLAGLIVALFGTLIAWADGLNVPFNFPATTCTNQFVRSIAAATGVGTCATVDNASLATMANSTVKGRITSGTGVPEDLTGANINTITGVTTNGTAAVGQLPGTTGNDDAAAGKVGEYQTAVSASLSSVPLTTATMTEVTSKSLTAGDWDVICVTYFSFGATTTVNRLQSGPSTSVNLDTTTGRFAEQQFPGTVIGSGGYTANVNPPLRFSLSSTVPIYCVAWTTFGISTASAGGAIYARRVR